MQPRKNIDGNTSPIYSRDEVGNQIDFMLRKSGKGYSENEIMLTSLLFDRTEMFTKLKEIADGDGNISMNEIRDFVEYYRATL